MLCLTHKISDRLIGRHHKSPKTRLLVTVAGQTIDHSKAADVFATALERIGLERVAQLKLRIAGIALVSHHAANSYQNQIHKDGWFITTHASNEEKKRMLETISQALQVPVRVEISK
jgi:hypothetical protein